MKLNLERVDCFDRGLMSGLVYSMTGAEPMRFARLLWPHHAVSTRRHYDDSKFLSTSSMRITKLR